MKYRERTLDQCYEKAGIEDVAVLFRVNKEFLMPIVLEATVLR